MALDYDSALTLAGIGFDAMTGLALTKTRIYALHSDRVNTHGVSVHNRQTGERLGAESFTFRTSGVATDICFAGDFLAVVYHTHERVFLGRGGRSFIDIVSSSGSRQSIITVDPDLLGGNEHYALKGIEYFPSSDNFLCVYESSSVGLAETIERNGDRGTAVGLSNVVTDPRSIVYDGESEQHYVVNLVTTPVQGGSTRYDNSIHVFDKNLAYVSEFSLVDADGVAIPNTPNQGEGFCVAFADGQLAVGNGHDTVFFYGSFGAGGTAETSVAVQQVFSDFDSAVSMHFVNSATLDFVSKQKALVRTSTEFLQDVSKLQEDLAIFQVVPYTTIPNLAIDDWIFPVDVNAEEDPTELPGEAYKVVGVTTAGIANRQIFYCELTDTS